MKKQILSISLAAALAVSCTGIAMAEDKTPTVFVNQGQIFFDDQAPVILGEGTTLVPARGVLQRLNGKKIQELLTLQVLITKLLSD